MNKILFKVLSIICVLAVLFCCLAACGKTASTDSEVQSSVNSLSGGFGTGNKPKISGVDAAWFTDKPTLTWKGLKDGQTAHILVTDSKGATVIDKTGLTGDSYTFETALKNGEFYTVKATYTTDSGEKKVSAAFMPTEARCNAFRVTPHPKAIMLLTVKFH